MSNIHLGSGLEKRVAIIVEKSGDSQEDNATASQGGFLIKVEREAPLSWSTPRMYKRQRADRSVTEPNVG